MSKLWILGPLIGFLIFFIGFTIIWLGVQNRLDTNVLRSQFTKLGDPLDVTFIPKYDFLNIVILTLKNPGLESQDIFNFAILDADGKVLRQDEFSGFNIGDPSDLRLQFEPISNSSGKVLTIRVTPKSVTNPKISVATDREGKLAFTTYYRVTDKRMALGDLLSGWVKKIAQDQFFFISWLIILGAVYLLGKNSKNKELVK